MAKINSKNRAAFAEAFTSNAPEPLRFVHIVARNLTELREQRGLTKSQAAELCKVSHRTWYYWESDIEHGTGASVGGSLDTIAAAFGVPVTRLLQMPKPARAPRKRETAGDAKRTRRFVRKSV